MSFHIHDIFNLVCKELTIPKMVHLELISKFHTNIIKNTEWYHSQLLVNDVTMVYFKTQYKFRNFKIENSVEFNHLDELEKCHTLNLECTKLSNKDIRRLHKCYRLNLSCSLLRLHRTTLAKLKYCHTLILDECSFWNRHTAILGKCNSLCLAYAGMEPRNIKYFKKCHTLYLVGNSVSNKSVKYLKNAHTLYFGRHSEIDQEHMEILKKRCFKVEICKNFI
jgi:hypothetical protein